MLFGKLFVRVPMRRGGRGLGMGLQGLGFRKALDIEVMLELTEVIARQKIFFRVPLLTINNSGG